MIPVYTQKNLDKLTWPEIQRLHKSLGLKTAPNARTRRDLQNNIVAAMPQPVAEPEQVATALTCHICPLARHIDGNRYCCKLTDTVIRGHWEASSDCYQAVANAQPKAGAPIAPQEIITTQAKILPAVPDTIAQTPHANVEEGIIVAMTKRTPFQEKMDSLDYLYELEMKAQLAIERTVIGSEEEAIAYAHLRQVERDIEFCNRPQPTPELSPAIQQLQNQMDELKQDIAQKSTLSLFKIEPFHQSILPTEPEQLSEEVEVEPEGTIHWETPLNGVIVGKKGAKRNFYLRNDEIFIMLSSDFTASETKHPNIRHAQIRAAIEAGRKFDPRIYMRYSFAQTENYNGIGRIHQECDGRWWAWSSCNQISTGHAFFSREIAINYLEKVAKQNLQTCAN
jgi:hypothetical protein